jgi:flagellar protein FliO/FliZ
MLTRLAIGTITVLGLSVVTLWAGRRWLRGQPPNATAAGQLRLVDSIALGSRCSLYLVQAGQRQVLAGVDGAGLKSLVTLTEPFEAALADAELPRIGPGDHELADRATPQPAAAEL